MKKASDERSVDANICVWNFGLINAYTICYESIITGEIRHKDSRRKTDLDN